MRQAILLITLFYGTSLMGQTLRSPNGYNLVWEDYFDTLNTDIWLVQNHFDHYGNELQVYTSRPENVFIEDGKLVLRTVRENYSCPAGSLHPWGCSRQYNTGQPYEYTSGWIETKPDYSMQYGYAEARISVPYGRGFWPAFWTFVGEGLPNHVNAAEIDIFEMLGWKPPYISTTNVHLEYCNENYPTYPDCSGIPDYYEEHLVPNYAFKYHVYSIEWTPEIIKWKMNDLTLRVMNNPGVVDPVRLIMNLAIDQNYPPNANTPFPADMKIDYIKVYSIDNVTSLNENISTKDGISLFPNPTFQNIVEIKNENNLAISYVKIMNGMGQVVAEFKPNVNPYQLDISELPKANYFIQITTNVGLITKPLIKL